jgi:5-methylcytosine-specific restriction enzyme A
MSEPRASWSRDELKAAVDAYIKMRERERSGEPFKKKNFYDELASQFPPRSAKAFEYRMQNISYVYSAMGWGWVKGLAPAKNVGAGVRRTIEELILEHEGADSPHTVEFEAKVSKLRREKNRPMPQGAPSPPKHTREIVRYGRKAEVAAWVLAASKDACESCEKPAPFMKNNGEPYLEVHHLRRLADGGSDKGTNAVAVCPNCHKELHFGIKREELLGNLYRRIPRLERE